MYILNYDLVGHFMGKVQAKWSKELRKSGKVVYM